MGTIKDHPATLILPAHLAREELLKRLADYLEEAGLQSKEFWKHFGSKDKAKMPIPFESVFDTVDNSVCYDNKDQFDLRILMTVIDPDDRSLFIDIASFVAEKYTNDKPASQLTLRQFKAELTLRLCQMGF